MANDTLINDVTDTALWVAHYRAKESQRSDAIFHDPFAARLAGQRGEQIARDMGAMDRYVEWSVVFRTMIIDQYILMMVGEGVDAVINLGTGLDSRPYRMNLPASLQWIEVDHPKIIRLKENILKNDKPVCKLTRIEADLSSDDVRKKVLQQAAGGAKKVLVLTEGVLPYLSEDQVAKLASDLNEHTRIHFWICEYFSEQVYRYLKDPKRTRKMKNAPFRFFPINYLGFFKSTGWTPRKIIYAGEIAHKFGRKVPMPIWAELVIRFFPAKVRKKLESMNGYMLLQKSSN